MPLVLFLLELQREGKIAVFLLVLRRHGWLGGAAGLRLVPTSAALDRCPAAITAGARSLSVVGKPRSLCVMTRAADQAEVAREELGTLAVDIDKRFPHDLGVRCVSRIRDKSEQLESLRVAVEGREVIVSEEDCYGPRIHRLPNNVYPPRGKLGSG